MKRKIAALMTLVLCVSLLGGCGGSSGGLGGSKEIAFSELLESDTIIYWCIDWSGADSFEGKDDEVNGVMLLRADGTYTHLKTSVGDGIKLGELEQQTDEEVIASFSEQISNEGGRESGGNYKLGIKTDGTGNMAESERILFANETSYDMVDITTYLGHVTVYDSSYMLFQDSDEDRYLIKDTSKTKDKDIVFDSVGTEGIYVDVYPPEAFQ